MAEDLHIVTGSKEEKYQALMPQLQGLLSGESDSISNLANVCAALKEQFGWLWVGFYLIKKNTAGADELVLGPFQGPVAEPTHHAFDTEREFVVPPGKKEKP